MDATSPVMGVVLVRAEEEVVVVDMTVVAEGDMVLGIGSRRRWKQAERATVPNRRVCVCV